MHDCESLMLDGPRHSHCVPTHRASERGFALRILFEGLKRISGLRVVRKKRFKEQQKKWRKKQRARFKQKTAELRSNYYLSGAHKKVDIRELDGFGAIASQVIADRMTKMNYDRLYTLWQAARMSARMSPDHMPIVEVGVYRGGSAKFIAESLRCASRTPHFYLCDTFTGHPRLDLETDSAHRDRSKFQDTSLQSVTEYLANYTNVEFVVGDIFETSRLLPQGPYGFVHVDVDVLPATDFSYDSLRHGCLGARPSSSTTMESRPVRE